MQVRTITVEREYGSGGALIARRLAERLGWKLWDQELTAEIAKLQRNVPDMRLGAQGSAMPRWPAARRWGRSGS